MNKTIALFCIALGIGQELYRVHPSSLSPVEGELSAQTVFNRASLNARALGLSPTEIPELELKYEKVGGRNWTIRWHDKLQYELNSRTGQIQGIVNWPKVDVFNKGRSAPATLALNTVAQAATRALAVFRLAEAPQDIYVEKVTLSDERENSFAAATVSVRRRHQGRRIIGAFGLATFDRADAALATLQQVWSYRFETQDPILTATQARVRAHEIYVAHVGLSDRYPIDNSGPELVYLPPGSAFGSTAYPKDETILRLRIAYIVGFGPDRIWVDAVNGNCLGGVKARERPTLVQWIPHGLGSSQEYARP